MHSQDSTKLNNNSSSLPGQNFKIAGLLPSPQGNSSFLKGKRRKDFIVFLVFAFFVAVFYGKALGNGFVHDDTSQIVENPDVQSLKYLSKVITSCPWEHRVFGGCEALSYYRPTMTLSYILTWQISSSPWFFHLINLLYFLTVVFLVFILIKTLTKNFILAFLTALIFLIHPVNSEVVNWIAAVPDVVYTIFILLSTIYFIKYRQNPESKNLLLVFLFYFLGIISKEPAVLLPVIFIYLDLFHFKITFNEIINSNKIRPYLAVVFSLIIYFTMRKLVLGHFGGVVNQYYGIFSLPDRIYAFFTLFTDYLLKLVKPFPLLLFYTYDKRADFFTPHFITSFIIVLAFFVAFTFFLIKRKNLLALALLWIFIFLFPVLVLVSSVGENIFTERYLFAPNIGFSFLLSFALVWLWRKYRYLRLLWMIVLIFIFGVSFYIIHSRNADWKNNDTLYTATLRDNPKAYTIHYDYGVYLAIKKGDWESSEREFKTIVELNPQWPQIYKIYNNLGDICRIRGDLDEALEYYKKSIEAGNWEYGVYNNIGAIYIEKEEYLNALIYFCQAVMIDPAAQKPNENLSRVSSIIDSTYQENLNNLWNDIIQNSIYKSGDREVIKVLQRNCNDSECSFEFSFQGSQTDVILPFLILGFSKDKAFKTEPSFDQKTAIIRLNTTLEHKEDVADFIFPTCNGIYYKVRADLSAKL